MKNLVILLSLTFFACRPEERIIPISQAEQKLVLNTRLGPDNSLFAAVSRTLPADQLGAKPGSLEWLEKVMVKDLVIIAEYQARRDTFNETDKGIYLLADFHLSEGEYAHLMVYGQGKLVLEAYTKAYDEAAVNNWEPEAKVQKQDTFCSISVGIEHQGFEEAWYLVGLSQWSEDLALIKNRKMTLSRILGDRKLLQQRAFLISSKEFDQGHYTFKKELAWLSGNDTLLVSVAKIDKDYKRYIEQQIKASNWLNQLVGEGINLKSNVIGGLGYFTLHRSKTKYFVMKEYLK